jgi:fatty-acyl-CoA synthase
VGTTVRLFDRLGTEVAPGETGRIFVGNGQGFSGYTGGGTKESIDGLLSTGDVGHFDGGGRLFVDGRDDEMIVSGGENVFPGEIEELLAGHPGISEASAVGVPDPDHGQRLIAYVVPTTPSGLTATEVKSYVRDNLARFKVPREVFFVEQLPRNPTGKVLKRHLLAHHAASDGAVDVEGSVPGPIV